MREQTRHVQRAILAALARGETLDPAALLFLLRLARESADEDLAGRIGYALAESLPEASRAPTVFAAAAWVALLVEIQPLSDDDRIDAALTRLLAELRGHWAAPSIAEAAAALDATLCAATLSAYAGGAAEAVDQLERLIGAHYHPGRPIGTAFPDQVHAASALLTAYELSGRLAYPMLAEELMQSAHRAVPSAFEDACAAARVLCRLALLHADQVYRAAAVIAPEADYRDDAAQLLAAIAIDADGRGAGGGIYGLALLELESAPSRP